MIYLYHGSEEVQKTTTNMATYMHNEISIAMHSVIQMKLYRAAIIHKELCYSIGKQPQIHTANIHIFKNML